MLVGTRWTFLAAAVLMAVWGLTPQTPADGAARRANGGVLISLLNQRTICLDSGTTSGSVVTVQTCDATKLTQQWSFSGTTLRNGAGLCLAMPLVVPSPGSQLQVTTCSGSLTQNWTFLAASNSLQYTGSVATLFCADSQTGNPPAGTAVVAAGCSNTDHQRWSFGFSDISVTTPYPAATTLKIKPGQSTSVAAFNTSNDPNHQTAPSATLTITVPTGVTMTGTTAVNWTCSATTSCTASNVTPGTAGSVTRTFTVPATATVGTKYQVTATAAVTGVQDVTGNDSATLVVEVVPLSTDLSMTTTTATVTSDPAQSAQLGFTLTNLGPDAADAATATFTWPAALTATALTASGGDWTCVLATRTCARTTAMAVSTPVTFQVTATVPAAADATATFAVSATAETGPKSLDPVSADNTATAVVVMSPVDLRVTKQGPAQGFAGAAVVYTVTVTNPGRTTVTGAAVQDAVPAVFTPVTWTCAASAGGTCTTATGTGNTIATTVTLAPGGTAVFTITATLPTTATGTVTNTATVTTPTGVTDPATSNNSASVQTTVSTQADMSVTKRVAT
ncbi:hypothetical protein Ssi02_18010 [Sinosporangium siamense]|uniref:Ricin B lectin domain-containing protein n=2 Tax=Sinosporangium siamense TaxID=1367973 RepID=A0A919RCU4_9ACTN|nr:hypothetical protein Ssi02_18010 [Sinosporangium siamense]